MNTLHPRMLCGKFGCILSSGSGEEDLLLSTMYFRYLVIISPWKRTGPFLSTNLNHPKILCAKFDWNWPSGSGEEDLLLSSMYFRYFVIIFLRKMHGPSFDQIWIPFTQRCFVPSLVEFGSVVLKKIFKFHQWRFAIW